MCPQRFKSLSFLPTLIHNLDWFCWWDGEGQQFWDCNENKVKLEQLSRKEVWGNPSGILWFQSTLLSSAWGRTWVFIQSRDLSRKRGQCRAERRQSAASSCWVEQTPKAAEMATKSPLPSIISESEIAMIAADFPYALLTKEIGGSARGDNYLTDPSPLSACCDTTLLQRSIWKIECTVWLRRLVGITWWFACMGT